MAEPIVIGAGWSGLACAVQLVRQGHRPLVLDAAPHVGGRARGFDHDLGGTRLRLDNGQHLLLGAYRDTLDLMREVGVAQGAAMARLPFAVQYPDGWRLAAARAPAPWHLGLGLLRAAGLPWPERLALARWAGARRRARWQIGADMPAAQLFAGEPPALVQRLWRPLCLAALNADLADASAQVLLNVLRDSLGAAARASDLLLPRTDLSNLFPDAAVSWLRARGAEVRLHTPVLGLEFGAAAEASNDAAQDPANDAARAAANAAMAGARRGAPRVRLRDRLLNAPAIVLAVPPERCADLLAGAPAAGVDATLRLLRGVQSAPICTVYLRYDPALRLPRVYYTLRDDPRRGHFGQWVFDRGALDPPLAGVLSVVISGAGPHQELGRSALGERVAAQIGAAFGLPAPIDRFVLDEKHATVLPRPGLERPGLELPLPGVFLASDAAHSAYPSTIEGSVRSGLDAARAVGRHLH